MIVMVGQWHFSLAEMSLVGLFYAIMEAAYQYVRTSLLHIVSGYQKCARIGPKGISPDGGFAHVIFVWLIQCVV